MPGDGRTKTLLVPPRVRSGPHGSIGFQRFAEKRRITVARAVKSTATVRSPFAEGYLTPFVGYRVASGTRVERTRTTTTGLVVLGAILVVGSLGLAAWPTIEGAQSSVTVNVVIGLLVTGGAGYNAYRVRNHVPASATVASILVALGFWLVVRSLLADGAGLFGWGTLAIGVATTILAGYDAYDARNPRKISREQLRGH